MKISEQKFIELISSNEMDIKYLETNLKHLYELRETYRKAYEFIINAKNNEESSKIIRTS